MPKSVVKRTLYRSIVGIIRTYSRLRWDFRVSGDQNLHAGPKLYVANHITTVDGYWLMMAAPEFLHFVVGPPYSVRWFAPILRSFEQINAMPEYRKFTVEQACGYLARAESVCILPEGDVQPPFQLGHFYSGLAKIYRRSLAPIVPVALAVSPRDIRRHPPWDMMVDGRRYEARIVWRGKVQVAFGKALHPALRDDVSEEEDNRRITEEVRAQIAVMLRDLAREFGQSTSS